MASQRTRYGRTSRDYVGALGGRTGDYPEVKTHIERHLGETRRQAEALEECIKRRGGDTSILRDMAGKIIAFGKA